MLGHVAEGGDAHRGGGKRGIRGGVHSESAGSIEAAAVLGLCLGGPGLGLPSNVEETCDLGIEAGPVVGLEDVGG